MSFWVTLEHLLSLTGLFRDGTHFLFLKSWIISLSQVGCEDGTVKLFEILEDKIQFERNLDRKKGKRERILWFSLSLPQARQAV